MAMIYFSGATQALSFENLKFYHLTIKTFLLEHQIASPLIFMVVYILLTAFSVPGAVFLSLLGGYLFPQPLCTIYVVCAATMGATAIFLATKTALGGSMKERAGPFLKKMESGFRKNAASYMLFLRLVPLFPFWIVNLAPAFFGVPLKTFVWTTLVGIIPATFVFTLAGSGLEQVFDTEQSFSIGAIFNTEIKIALTLLGILALIPIIVRRKNDRSPPS